MATSSSDTSHVQVKVEKPDSPLSPQIQTCQISSTEMSMKSPGNRLYDHSENIAKKKRIQLGDRPQCSVCMKTFSRSGTLRVHMRIHNGEKPFQCRFCPKKFAQSGNLAAHERIHTGEKPFECKYCGKRFTQSSAQKSHTMTHISKELL
ncbi:unnamed protein product [Porites evermanni]|uniref:C2H2-type domain-containing protein n=1 Tax=Porites evermanni TaxID=104178 RepID=A0ABN8ML83_9CNID|nr:unnamed protein product [Porites evermanni]